MAAQPTGSLLKENRVDLALSDTLELPGHPVSNPGLQIAIVSP